MVSTKLDRKYGTLDNGHIYSLFMHHIAWHTMGMNVTIDPYVGYQQHNFNHVQ
jgi:hypothetical protein